MRIPQGDWIVIARNVRDNKTRGQILKTGMKEHVAKAYALNLRETGRGVDYWAIPYNEY